MGVYSCYHENKHLTFNLITLLSQFSFRYNDVLLNLAVFGKRVTFLVTVWQDGWNSF